MIKTLLRVIFILVPIAVALSLGRAYQAGTLAQKHVSNIKAIGFIAAVFAVACLALYLTRDKPAPQGRSYTPSRRR